MREEVRLKNMEEKIERMEVILQKIKLNETENIYLPFVNEKCVYYLLGKGIIGIETNTKNQIVDAREISISEYAILARAKIIITITKIDETVNNFIEDIENKIDGLSHECERIRRKVRKAV